MIEPAEVNRLASPYRTGLCDALALALHRQLGLPLALWVGHETDPDDPEETWATPAHAVVTTPDRRAWLDVDGWHQAPPDNLFFNGPVERISLEPATAEDVRYAFTTEGVTEDQETEALAVWRQLGGEAWTPPAAEPVAAVRRRRP